MFASFTWKQFEKSVGRLRSLFCVCWMQFFLAKMKNQATECSVIVVGAGMAGLTAARFLADNSDLDVVLLETNTQRYGGRIWSYELPEFEGKPVELGAMWLHGGSSEKHCLRILAKMHGLDMKKHEFLEDTLSLVYDTQGKVVSGDQLKDLGRVKEALYCDLRKKRIDEGLEDISLQEALDFLDPDNKNLLNEKIIRNFELPSLESYEGSTLDQISLMYCGGIPGNESNSVKFEEGACDVILPKGYSQLLDILLKHGRRKFRLELGKHVEKISYEVITPSQAKSTPHSCVTVLAKDPTNPSRTWLYRADHVILAVPLGVLQAGRISFDPPLPHGHTKAFQKLGSGNMVKVVLVFNEIFWPASATFFMCQTEEPTGFPLCFINMQEIHGLPALMAIISSKGAPAADLMSEGEITQKLLTCLKKMFGKECVEERILRHAKVTNWKKNPDFLCAYSFTKIGMSSEDAFNVQKSVNGRVFFAGEHTSLPEDQLGTVLGAYLSGVRVGRQILLQRNLLEKSLAPHEKYLSFDHQNFAVVRHNDVPGCA